MSVNVRVGRHKIRFTKHGDLYFHGNVWAQKVTKLSDGKHGEWKHWWRAGSWDGDDYAEVEGPTLAGCYRAVARAFT